MNEKETLPDRLRDCNCIYRINDRTIAITVKRLLFEAAEEIELLRETLHDVIRGNWSAEEIQEVLGEDKCH